MIDYPTQVTAEIDDAKVIPTIRRPEFDWSQVKIGWCTGTKYAPRAINILHIILPAGERWFVDVYKQTLPLIDDEHLLAQLRAFIGQEAMHAEAHAGAAELLLKANGLDSTPWSKWVDFLLGTILGDHTMPRFMQPRWLRFRVGLIAGIEHYTAVLGQYIMDANKAGTWKEYGADPVMTDICCWHGAEEVEHRFIAYDTYTAMGGGFLERAVGMVIVGPILIGLLANGAQWLILNDPDLTEAEKKPARRLGILRVWKQEADKGMLPYMKDLWGAMPRYLRRDYHPSHEGNTADALAYLATSPAVNKGMRSSAAS